MQSDVQNFTAKLKAVSSNFRNMSASVESPNIPLVRLNGNPNYDSTPAATPRDAEKGYKGGKAGKKWSK